MKVCVFGADGKTGVEVVSYAVGLGFEVVAFVYRNKSQNSFPEGVEVKVGDIMNYDAVLNAISGVDAVISVIGHISGSDPLMQTKGITNVIKAMEAVGIKRIISLTGTGARNTEDTPSLIDKVLNYFVKLVDPNRINDGIKHVEVLKQSHLDWTVVRVLKLGESKSIITHYNLNSGGPAELQTSRKKVAKILVDLVSTNKYVRMMPVVAK